MSTTVFKTTVPSLPNSFISPGSFHGCRIAVHSEDSFIIASDKELNLIQVQLNLQNSSKNNNKKYVTTLIPCTKQSILQQKPHQAEIQNILLSSTNSNEKSKLLFSIDQTGSCSVHSLIKNEIKYLWTMSPTTNGFVELGWSGIAVSSLNPTKVNF
jgi:uncharacterized protein YpiB (UPF0302 family)